MKDTRDLILFMILGCLLTASSMKLTTSKTGSLSLQMIEKLNPVTTPEPTQASFAWPIDPQDYVALSSPYGERDPATVGGYGDDFHDGLDLFGTWHARIRAAADAYVACVFPAPNGYYRGHHVLGGLVILQLEHQSETYHLIYGHMSEVAVKEGDMVKPGDLLGRQGNSGRSGGPHLHFAIIQNGVLEVDTGEITGGEWLNPLQYIKEPKGDHR